MYTRRRTFTSILLFLLLDLTLNLSFSTSARSQTGIITGMVFDSVSHEPLFGANVHLLGTQRGVTTNEEGRFDLGPIGPGEHHLRFTFVGYEPEERILAVTSGDSLILRVALTPEEIHSELIVVTGTRTLRSISDVPVRVEAIPEEEIEEKLLMTPSNVAMLLN